MLNDIHEGNGPHYLRTDKAMQKMFVDAQNDPKKVREIEADAWEDFLDMTMSQAHIWASENIDPAKQPSEIVLTEPYLMGSHASGTGAWVSGPEDVAPEGYHWGYNRMTSVNGLFAAGDAVGASAHKFSSGSFTEGRLAGKAAVQFVLDNDAPQVDDDRIEEIRQDLYKPFATLEQHRGTSTRVEINPNYLLPKQALLRLQKIMDEYAAGWGANYRTNRPMLERGLELLHSFQQDCENLAARDLHDLLRCWEVKDRALVAEANIQHMLFREETRWPGYYYRMDFPKLDDENWKAFVVSKFSRNGNGDGNWASGSWDIEKIPHASKID
jgi:adenylylsulfate reductase subunit A